MSRERLSSADRSALAFDAPETPMHIFAIAWLAPAEAAAAPSISLDALRGHVAARLPHLPRLRQIIRGGVGLFGRAEWVAAGGVDLARHVTECALAAPGGERELLELAARMFMEPLDRRFPLWELRLVHGLADGGTALFVKMHHAIADGPAAVRMLTALFDAGPVSQDAPPAPPDRLSPAARLTPLVRSTMPVRPAASAASAIARVRRYLDALADLSRAPALSVDRPVGVGRRLALVRLALPEAKAVAHRSGATVNDVFVTLAAAGVAAVLERRGEIVRGGRLRASVFVGLRTDRAELGNETGLMTVPVPAGVGDPWPALASIASATADAKRRQPAAGMAAVSYLVTRAGLGRILYRHQRQTNFFTTNVVGPRSALSLLGAPIGDLATVTALGGNVGIAFAALSYAGRITVTVVGDADALPEVDLVADAMCSTWDDLRAHT